MKVLQLRPSEKMLLALLRSAIHQQEAETVDFQQATEQDWVECYMLALRQGVLSLAWDGAQRLPAQYHPPLNVKLSFALREKDQTARYRVHCLAASKITHYLAQHGIATIILKGVGLSRLYPTPSYREGGDIDIYTYSADTTQMTDEEANRLADEILLKQGALTDDSQYEKHSKLGLHGVTIENHRMFLHISGCQTLVKAEQWLQAHLAIQPVELLDGECHIAVPSIAFDSVFIPLHAAQHYGSGLSLKHLCDWILLLKQNGHTLPSEFDDKYFQLTVTTLTHLCNQYLGLSIPVEANCRFANDMMQEILRPRYHGNTPSGGRVKQYMFRIQHMIYIFRLTRRLLGVSFWGKIRGLSLSKIKEHILHK